MDAPGEKTAPAPVAIDGLRSLQFSAKTAEA
jgi:hypothetical protein